MNLPENSFYVISFVLPIIFKSKVHLSLDSKYVEPTVCSEKAGIESTEKNLPLWQHTVSDY